MKQKNNKNSPLYSLEKILFGTDRTTLERAIDLYEKDRVTRFRSLGSGFSATVLGGSPYDVFVSSRHYDEGGCSCYIGQQDVLCKHMVALAIYAILRGRPFPKEEAAGPEIPHTSNVCGELAPTVLTKAKEQISDAVSYIKAYNGPSKMWFRYQSSLGEGCRRLSHIFSKLPISFQTANLIVKTLLRLDKKLSNGGVDDSNGTVGDLIQSSVEMLLEYVKLDPACRKAFATLEGKQTCFGWEEKLVSVKSQKKKDKIFWQSINDISKSDLIWDEKSGRVENARSTFSRENLVGTGLGGSGSFLRYAIVLSPLPMVDFSLEKVTVVNGIKKLNLANARLEKVKAKDKYLSLLLVVDWDTAVESVVREIIDIVNAKQNILRSHYLCVNTHIPNTQEINRYLREIKGYNRTDWDER